MGMLLVAREHAPTARLVRLDLESLPLRSGASDGAVCGHALQFVPDLASSLAEAARVLRPGAVLAASVPAGRPGSRRVELVEELFDAHLPPSPKTPDRAATLAVLGDAERCRGAALDAGFAEAAVEVVEEATHYPSPRAMVVQVMGWWDCAMRLKGVDAVAQRRLLDQISEELERRGGDGPIELPGRSHVLVARR
jgi:SAM-dependent methyltransferase